MVLSLETDDFIAKPYNTRFAYAYNLGFGARK